MVNHSKENALNEKEYEKILQSIERIDCDWYRLQTRFVVLMSGRLGMRAGEIAHMDEEWVDYREGMIHIPKQDTCTKGENGGSCGYCRSLAKSVVDHAVPTKHEAQLNLLEQGNLVHLGMVYQELLSTHKSYVNNLISKEEFDNRITDSLCLGQNNGYNNKKEYEKLEKRAEKFKQKKNVSLDEALERYWIPKTEASARDIPFNFDPRLEMVVEEFFDRVDRYPTSRTTVNRRVDDALEMAGKEKNECSPHGLRATAASYHSGRGLNVVALQSMFGWVQLDTAMKYIKNSGTNTQRALNSVHRK